MSDFVTHLVAGVMLILGVLCFAVALMGVASPEPDARVSQGYRNRLLRQEEE